LRRRPDSICENPFRTRGDPPEARRAIGRAQCNDAYWHGVFGGLYLPHLRNAIWRQLAIAERVLRRGESLAYEELDLNYDGYPELWIHSAQFSAVISPHRGGAIETLTRFADLTNLADVLTRRRESYHEIPKQDSQGHAVQPRGDAAILLQHMGPSSEDEEDRLEGVVGVGH